jgi:hypothetical protein
MAHCRIVCARNFIDSLIVSLFVVVVCFTITVVSDSLCLSHLMLALMDIYVAVGIVEGLDVDKDTFDKYRGARFELSFLEVD